MCWMRSSPNWRGRHPQAEICSSSRSFSDQRMARPSPRSLAALKSYASISLTRASLCNLLCPTVRKLDRTNSTSSRLSCQWSWPCLGRSWQLQGSSPGSDSGTAESRGRCCVIARHTGMSRGVSLSSVNWLAPPMLWLKLSSGRNQRRERSRRQTTPPDQSFGRANYRLAVPGRRRSRSGPPLAGSPPVSTRCAGAGLRPLTRGPSSLLPSGGAAGMNPRRPRAGPSRDRRAQLRPAIRHRGVGARVGRHRSLRAACGIAHRKPEATALAATQLDGQAQGFVVAFPHLDVERGVTAAGARHRASDDVQPRSPACPTIGTTLRAVHALTCPVSRQRSGATYKP